MSELVNGVRDARRRARIPTCVVTKSLLVMMLNRLGSLNALEQTAASSFWRRFLRADLPSADTLGRVAAGMELDSLRHLLQVVYSRLRRNKALAATAQGLLAVALDGHESHASYKRCCQGCLRRTITTQQGQRVQFYHRHVTAMLLAGNYPIFLDAEPIRPGEDEISTAVRLLERLLEHYPRAFDVVLGDALYTDPRIFNLALAHKKDVLSVLKDENRSLLADARALWQISEPQERFKDNNTTREIWDLEGFTTWPQVEQPVRVVRSIETSRRLRQRDAQYQTNTSEWVWVTTLSANRAGSKAAVTLGHARWCIENEGFNETVNRWQADHVYKHHPTAMLAFWLLTMLAFNLFYTFFFRNLKPAYRSKHSALHVAWVLAADLYHSLPENRAPPQ